MSRSDPLPSRIGIRAEREALPAQIGPLLSAQALEKLRQIFSGLNELLARLESRDLSLVKLRELLFGASTGWTDSVMGCELINANKFRLNMEVLNCLENR